jgi:voltage-gated potassium channel Kch
MQQAFDRHIYRILLVAVLVLLTIGTVFYHLVEGLSWINAYYFSVVSLATVGYGDFAPHTNAGKIFTTFYIIFGVGLLTTFISYNFRRSVDRIQRRSEKKQQK